MMTSSHPELVRQLKSEVDKVVERWAQNVLARASPAQETATEAEATATIAALLEQKDKLQEEVDVKAAHIAALEAPAGDGGTERAPDAKTIKERDDAHIARVSGAVCVRLALVRGFQCKNLAVGQHHILHTRNCASPRTLRSPPRDGPAPGRMEKGG